MSPMRWMLLLLCVLLAGCFSRPRAVVVERSTEPTVSRSVRHDARPTVREYLVARGDTLYGIAFRHGLDFRELARWNGIPSPYTIYPGQRLRLGSGVAARPATPRAPVATAAPPPARNSITGMPPPATTSAPVAAPRPPTSMPASTEPPTPTSSTSASSTATPPASPPATPSAPIATRNAQGVSWRWPASGQIVSRFTTGDPTRQGINIAGNGGQPVYAAAAGDVVYSGAGLIGYGELVIIKHSDEFLSAYGHNRKRLVAEGQRVTAGQHIAEMGRSGAARDMLHFEIRRNGKPVDPLPLLPRQ